MVDFGHRLPRFWQGRARWMRQGKQRASRTTSRLFGWGVLLELLSARLRHAALAREASRAAKRRAGETRTLAACGNSPRTSLTKGVPSGPGSVDSVPYRAVTVRERILPRAASGPVHPQTAACFTRAARKRVGMFARTESRAHWTPVGEQSLGPTASPPSPRADRCSTVGRAGRSSFARIGLTCDSR
jgi:hypothetical protein